MSREGSKLNVAHACTGLLELADVGQSLWLLVSADLVPGETDRFRVSGKEL